MTSITESNRQYWDDHADLWFGTDALPHWGVLFPTEDELHFFQDIAGKRVVEICCGSGHSLAYLAQRGAAELWGVDISQSQLNNAETVLRRAGASARLLCSPMEEMELPESYFDCAYSIYGMGWATDLAAVFAKIHRALRPGGMFAFTWHHPLYDCVARDRAKARDRLGPGGSLPLDYSYFDEDWYVMPVHDSTVTLRHITLSTWVNALAEAGFCLERIVEKNDPAQVTAAGDSPKAAKAAGLPISILFQARKR